VNPSLRQLRAFREVMRLGSVSAAARTLHRTQPAVSAMVASLEEELGYPLFERARGRLVPLPEARYFLEEVDEVLERLTDCMQRMQEIGALERGRLRIACLPAASSFLMPRLVTEFVRERPAVDVSLRMQSSKVLEEWVASQQYDIGLAETPEPRPALRVRPFRLQCLCALPADDPLAEQDAITPADLDGAPMAALYPEHQTRQLTAAAFAEAGARYRVRFELQTFLPSLSLVENGVCYCVCDPITAVNYGICRGSRRSVTFLPFTGAVPFDLAILTPAHRPLAILTRAFLERLEAELERIRATPPHALPALWAYS